MKAILKSKGPGRGWWGPPKGTHTAQNVPGGEGGGGSVEERVKVLERQGYKVAYGSKQEIIEAQWDSFRNSGLLERDLDYQKSQLQNEIRRQFPRDKLVQWSREGIGSEEIRKRIDKWVDDEFEKKKPALIEQSHDRFVKNWQKKLPDDVVIANKEELSALVTGLEQAHRSGGIQNDVLYVLRNPATETERWQNGVYNGGNILVLNSNYVELGITNSQGEFIKTKGFYSQSKMGEQKSTSSFVYKNYYEGVFTHEYGHHLARKSTQVEARANEMASKYGKTRISSLISSYAGDVSSELAAEAYALKRHPDFAELPSEAKQIVNYIWEGVDK